jgi:hypothetical protein
VKLKTMRPSGLRFKETAKRLIGNDLARVGALVGVRAFICSCRVAGRHSDRVV